MDSSYIEALDPNTIQIVLTELNTLINKVSFFSWETLTESMFFYLSVFYIVMICITLVKSFDCRSVFYSNWPEGYLGKTAMLGRWLLLMFSVPTLLALIAFGLYSYREDEKSTLVCQDYAFKNELLPINKTSDRPLFLPKFRYRSEDALITALHQLPDNIKSPLIEKIKVRVIDRPSLDRQEIIINEVCRTKKLLEQKRSSSHSQNQLQDFIKQLEEK